MQSRQQYKLISLILLISISMTPCQAQQDDRFTLLHEQLQQLREQREIPAIAWVISGPDDILHSGIIGHRDIHSQEPADSNSIFRIGSVTKTFTALALLKASEMGLFSLDAEIKQLVPNIPVSNTWQATHPIKVIHLLEHTSGLQEMSGEEFNATEPMSLEQALWWKPERRRTQWPPGKHHSYNNVGAGLAAWILQLKSEQPYESFVKQYFTTPLDMSSASFYPNDTVLKDLVSGYDSDGKSRLPYWHVLYRAFGGLNVRPIEMAGLIQLLLNKGQYREQRLLSQASITRMEQPATTLAARHGLKFGYAAGLYTYLRDGFVFHGHGGDADGYLSFLGYNRNTSTGYFVVINVFRNADLRRARALIEAAILSQARKTDIPGEIPLAPDVLQDYVGEYVAVTKRFGVLPSDLEQREKVLIQLKNGELRIKRNAKEQRLFPITTQFFRYQGESLATAAFIRDTDSRLYFQDDLGNYLRLH